MECFCIFSLLQFINHLLIGVLVYNESLNASAREVSWGAASIFIIITI